MFLAKCPQGGVFIIFLIFVDFSGEDGGTLPKIVINLPGTYKKNPNVSAVSEILWFKHTNTQTNRHPITLLQGYIQVFH